ncbi:MAG TPA: glycosyltransferase [Nocardioidaceae bacterium]|nr:glycosyltransferase [Nocardioidaceae bacterium]
MPVPAEEPGGLHVLRLCSVFEPEAASIDERAARFDPIGGMQNHTAALSRCLDAQGVTQTVLTARLGAGCGTGALGRRGTVRRVGVRTSRLRQLWGLAALPYVIGARRPVDLVHAHQGEDVATLVLALVAHAVHRCPLVVTLHCSVRHTVTGRSPRSWLLRVVGGAVERLALRRADAVLVLVPRTAELLEKDGLSPGRVHVLPSGFEPALFTGPHHDAFPDLGRPRIGYVGRLAESKRPDLLVEAFGRMREVAVLVVVGDGPLRAEVRAAVQRSPARERITMRGFLPHADIPQVLASLDVLALPSVYEEMGSVLVEAMASGLPVVASRVGGIPAVVQDGETGLLVRPRDVTALAAALDELVADPGRRERMCRAARRRATGYSWPDLARRVASVYGDVLRAEEPARP